MTFTFVRERLSMAGSAPRPLLTGVHVVHQFVVEPAVRLDAPVGPDVVEVGAVAAVLVADLSWGGFVARVGDELGAVVGVERRPDVGIGRAAVRGRRGD